MNKTPNSRDSATQRAKAAKLAKTLKNPDELAAAISTYALLELTVESLQLEAEAEIKALTERFQTRIEAKRSEMADLLPQIEDYTRTHRKELFKSDAKTARIGGHEVSLHWTPPKVDTRRGVTQKAVLARLIEHEDATFADPFIRWTEALNKEAVLDAWDATTEAWKPGMEQLGELGLEIVRTEQFSLKTNRVLTESKTSKGDSVAAAAA